MTVVAIALSSELLLALVLVIALVLPSINSPTVPFGVRVPAPRANDPTVVRQTRLYRFGYFSVAASPLVWVPRPTS